MVDRSLFLDPSCCFNAPPTKVNISLSFLKSCSMIQFLPFISRAMQKQGHLHKPSRVLLVSRVVGQTASLCGKRVLRAQTLNRIFNLLLPPAASAGSQRHTAICGPPTPCLCSQMLLRSLPGSPAQHILI